MPPLLGLPFVHACLPGEVVGLRGAMRSEISRLQVFPGPARGIPPPPDRLPMAPVAE